jgi:hypothetical protein
VKPEPSTFAVFYKPIYGPFADAITAVANELANPKEINERVRRAWSNAEAQAQVLARLGKFPKAVASQALDAFGREYDKALAHKLRDHFTQADPATQAEWAAIVETAKRSELMVGRRHVTKSYYRLTAPTARLAHAVRFRVECPNCQGPRTSRSRPTQGIGKCAVGTAVTRTV